MPGTFIVIAAYNEGQVVRGVVAGLVERGYQVVVVDDGSRDDTGTQARQGGATVLRHVINRGQGAALQSGITYALRAGADYIVTFDADGQHSVDDIEQLLASIKAGEVEYVLGSRFLGDKSLVPRGRRFLLWGARMFTFVTSGVRRTDAHNGLRALSRKAAEVIDIRLDRMAHASELVEQLARSGLPFKEVPVHIVYTEYSMAKGQTAGSAFKVALDYLVGRLFG